MNSFLLKVVRQLFSRGLLLLLLLCGMSTFAPAQTGPDMPDVLRSIARKGSAVVAAYQPDNALASAQAMSDLYFNEFESLEGILGSSDKRAMVAMESAFGRVNSLMMRGRSVEEVESAWHTLHVLLEETAERHARAAADGSAGSGWVIFLQSFFILAREGAEAMLVIAALVAYLRRSEAPPLHLHTVYGGAVAALFASLGTAWVMFRLLQASGSARESFEGLMMLAAAAMLLYVSAWLFARRDAERWRSYLRIKTDHAMLIAQDDSVKGLLVLGGTAFLAVYREGVETVLFYQALLARADGQGGAVIAGFVAAGGMLAALFMVIRKLSVRLPLGPFFVVTALMLYVMALVFAGQGVMELQNAGWIPRTSLDLPELPSLGVFASAEGLGVQVMLLSVIGFAAWHTYRARQI